jgi:zinc protease
MRLPSSLCLGLALLLPLAALAPRAGAADEKETGAALKAAAALYDGIRVETLDNGLKVYLKPVAGSPVVTVMTAYKVGSSDEDLTATGLSHYLEHLMFKGTEKIKPGDIDRTTLRNGGANNAYTSEDYTIYHFDFDKDRWQVALEIEADRMRNLRIDKEHEFDKEKGAVINELLRNEDEPWDLEQKAILPMLFGKTAPYGHPVIGLQKHVEEASAEVIKAHYDKWYHPNNASLIIAGGIDADEALKAVKKHLGGVPSAKLPERKPLPKDLPKRPAEAVMESKFDLPRMLMGFGTVRKGDPDEVVLDVVQALLTGGRTGRLYRKLVEGDEVAVSVDSGNFAGRYPGWYSVQVEMIPGKDRATVEKTVLAELKKLADSPASDAELKRAKQSVLANAIFSRESVHGLADSIARGVTVGDLDQLKTYLPRILAVTAKDVQRAAGKYLAADERVVVWSLPKKEGTGNRERGTGEKRVFGRKARGGAGEPAVAKEFSLKDAQRVELPNGLTLLLYERRRLPIVVAEAFVRDVALREPENKAGVASLIGKMLSEGTKEHSGPQIAEMIEDVGGILSMSATGGSVEVLSPDRKLGLGLLFECLSQSEFPKDALERVRGQVLSNIEDEERSPENRARWLYRELAYGKHPAGRSPMAEKGNVAKLTRDDCLAFYRKVFVPNNTIVAVVGDFDSKAVVEEITALTKDWKKGELPKIEAPAVEKPEKFVQKVITMPNAQQLHFYMGHAGTRRDDPNYYKLLVMDYVLGTGPGFTDRLSARLRDRLGLAYTVTANISNSATEQPGLFTCYIGTYTDKFAEVKGLFLEELNRIRDEEPTKKEVEDAKLYLVHNLPFRFTTNAGIAAQLLAIERYHLGFDYVQEYVKGVEAVTAADVQAVAKKYLDPAHMVLVAAGAVDAEGKPLTKIAPPKK